MNRIVYIEWMSLRIPRCQRSSIFGLNFKITNTKILFWMLQLELAQCAHFSSSSFYNIGSNAIYYYSGNACILFTLRKLVEMKYVASSCNTVFCHQFCISFGEMSCQLSILISFWWQKFFIMMSSVFEIFSCLGTWLNKHHCMITT